MKQIAKPLNTISLHTCVWVVIGSTSGMAPTLFLLFVQPNMSCLPSQSTILRYCTLAIGCPIPTHHWIFSGWILQGRWSHQTLGFYMLYSFQSIFSEVVKSSRILKSKGKPFYVAAQVHWWICHASKLRWFVGTECIQSILALTCGLLGLSWGSSCNMMCGEDWTWMKGTAFSLHTTVSRAFAGPTKYSSLSRMSMMSLIYPK